MYFLSHPPQTHTIALLIDCLVDCLCLILPGGAAASGLFKFPAITRLFSLDYGFLRIKTRQKTLRLLSPERLNGIPF